jgi:hypothetical protein
MAAGERVGLTSPLLSGQRGAFQYSRATQLASAFLNGEQSRFVQCLELRSFTDK